HFLLNFVECRAKGIPLCGEGLFTPPCIFFCLLLCRFHARRGFRFHLLRLRAQLGRRFFGLRTQGLQSLLRGGQLPFVLLALQRSLVSQMRGQFMRELFQLRCQPARQFAFDRLRRGRLCPASLGQRFFLDGFDGLRGFAGDVFAEGRVFLF